MILFVTDDGSHIQITLYSLPVAPPRGRFGGEISYKKGKKTKEIIRKHKRENRSGVNCIGKCFTKRNGSHDIHKTSHHSLNKRQQRNKNKGQKGLEGGGNLSGLSQVTKIVCITPGSLCCGNDLHPFFFLLQRLIPKRILSFPSAMKNSFCVFRLPDKGKKRNPREIARMIWIPSGVSPSPGTRSLPVPILDRTFSKPFSLL